jgi:hypothetical protein
MSITVIFESPPWVTKPHAPLNPAGMHPHCQFNCPITDDGVAFLTQDSAVTSGQVYDARFEGLTTTVRALTHFEEGTLPEYLHLDSDASHLLTLARKQDESRVVVVVDRRGAEPVELGVLEFEASVSTSLFFDTPAISSNADFFFYRSNHDLDEEFFDDIFTVELSGGQIGEPIQITDVGTTAYLWSAALQP